jgi:hypothetical protein
MERNRMNCEYCGVDNAQSISAMTAYYWAGEGENPNRDLVLCNNCAQNYQEYWQDMWDEYNDMVYEGLQIDSQGYHEEHSFYSSDYDYEEDRNIDRDIEDYLY